MSGHDKIYDEILLEVDCDGKFQKYYNYKYNLIFVTIGAMTYFNYVLFLAVPDHWCYVPGINSTNYTLEEWKSIHIPWDPIKNRYDKCSMYDINKNSTTTCKYGMEYDKTWYTETVPSKENWVCDEDMKVINSFEFGRLGEILGTFIFACIGDRFGRIPVFYIALTTLAFGRLSTLFTTTIYPLFLLSLVVGSISSNVIFQAILIIAFEISKDEKRSMLSYLQCVSWTIGLCILPLVYWYFRTWVPFLLVTTAPLILFYFFREYMIESPRWLANKGYIDKCLAEFKKICDANKTTIPDNLISNLRNVKKLEDTKSDNTTSLFRNKSIAKITVLSMIGWSCWNLIYVILYLNITNLHGNPYMNFFWQSLAELPGYVVGKYASDYLGRRFSRMLAFLITGIGCIVLVLLIPDLEYHVLVDIISIIMKCSISMGYYVTCLHTLEIFPTNVRQTGSSLGFLAGNIASLLAPYIIHLGVILDPRIPYIVASLLGIIAALFTLGLPETLNEKLPETIEEIDDFTKRQRFWPIVKRYEKCSDVKVQK